MAGRDASPTIRRWRRTPVATLITSSLKANWDKAMLPPGRSGLRSRKVQLIHLKVLDMHYHAWQDYV
jgi:hypothetical protein